MTTAFCIMTPKEKAEELIDKYSLLVPIEFGGMDKNLAKQCALIAVDEQIKILELIHKPEYVSVWVQEQYFNIYDLIEYFQEVKSEIEKL
jgi:hypothetical protein